MVYPFVNGIHRDGRQKVWPSGPRRQGFRQEKRMETSDLGLLSVCILFYFCGECKKVHCTLSLSTLEHLRPSVGFTKGGGKWWSFWWPALPIRREEYADWGCADLIRGKLSFEERKHEVAGLGWRSCWPKKKLPKRNRLWAVFFALKLKKQDDIFCFEEISWQ